MADEQKNLCDNCHERPVLHHLVTFCGETEQKRDLCPQCFEGLASPDQLEAVRQLKKAIRSGKCKYCGAPAVAGSSGNLWCQQCHQDLVEFNNRSENELPVPDFDDDKQLGQWQRLVTEREERQKEFMHRRVDERKGRGGRTNREGQ